MRKGLFPKRLPPNLKGTIPSLKHIILHRRRRTDPGLGLRFEPAPPVELDPDGGSGPLTKGDTGHIL